MTAEQETKPKFEVGQVWQTRNGKGRVCIYSVCGEYPSDPYTEYALQADPNEPIIGFMDIGVWSWRSDGMFSDDCESILDLTKLTSDPKSLPKFEVGQVWKTLDGADEVTIDRVEKRNENEYRAFGMLHGNYASWDEKRKSMSHKYYDLVEIVAYPEAEQ